MSELQSIFAQPFLIALGWALLHFIWQGATVAIMVAGLLFVLQGYSANIRYGIALASMLLLPLLFIGTIWNIWMDWQEVAIYSRSISPVGRNVVEPSQIPDRRPEAVSASDIVAQSQTPMVGIRESNPNANELGDTPSHVVVVESQRFSVRLKAWVVSRLQSLLPWVVLIWLTGVLALSLRLGVGWKRALHLKNQGVMPAAERLRACLLPLCQKMRVSRPVCLLESALVAAPTVIGWLRPVILLPASALIGLTPTQLESVIAHELAHIRRHDYLFNLIQSVVETVLFYHPAVWWLGKQVRVERENCCDDLAVAVCGDAFTYARALTEMAALRHTSTQLLMAVNNGSLFHRVRRLVNAPSAQSDRLARRLVGVLAMAMICIMGVGAYFLGESMAVAGKTRAVIEADASEQTSTDLIHALRDESEQRRFRAACLLGQVRDEAAIPALIETLRDPSRQVRLQAAYALSSISEQAPVLVLAEALGGGYGGTQLQAAYALSYIPDAATVPTLINALGDDSETMRVHAANALRYVSNRAAVPALIESLKDESEAVRQSAAQALSCVPHESAVPALIDALRDESVWVRQHAACALGRIPDRRATSALIAALGDESEQVRQRAVYALGRIGDQAATPVLIQALKDESEQVRLQATYALSQMPDAAAIPALITALSDDSPQVREGAAYALGKHEL